MRRFVMIGLPFLLLAPLAAIAQDTAPGTPDFVDEATQALVDIAGANSDKDAAKALIRLADRLMLNLQEKVKAGKNSEAAAIAEAYRVVMREGLSNLAENRKLKVQQKAKAEAGEGEGDKTQTKAQKQAKGGEGEGDQTQAKAQKQAKGEDKAGEGDKTQAKTQDRVREQDRTRKESKQDEESVEDLIAAAMNRHANALSNAMGSASPEAQRSLQLALQACEGALLGGGSTGPGGGSTGSGGGSTGPRVGAPSEPPRVPPDQNNRPAPEQPRGGQGGKP